MSHIHGESIEEVELQCEEKMESTIGDLSREMMSIRTGRASVHLLDPIRVDYYGSPTPISQMANIATPEATLITIQPWDTTQIGAIEKAIQQSELGLTPQNDGKLIRLTIPALTQERRQELVKQLHTMLEKHRVAVRNIRRDANDVLKKLEKDGTISEDNSHRSQENIQEITDDTIKKLEATAGKKEKEILEIG